MNPDLTPPLPNGAAVLALRDIVLPPRIGWWPPAPGWWILLLLLVATSAIGVWLWRKRRQRLRLLKPAQETLGQIERRFSRHGGQSRWPCQGRSTCRRASTGSCVSTRKAGWSCTELGTMKGAPCATGPAPDRPPRGPRGGKRGSANGSARKGPATWSPRRRPRRRRTRRLREAFRVTFLRVSVARRRERADAPNRLVSTGHPSTVWGAPMVFQLSCAKNTAPRAQRVRLEFTSRERP